MKDNLVTTILRVILVIGLSLLLYPTVADLWNKRHFDAELSYYVEQSQDMSEEERTKLWEAAVAYNDKLRESGQFMSLSDEMKEEYYKQLKLEDSNVMGGVNIPSINVNLPIYHGTDESILSSGIGHLEWSSLPVGGEGTHCVISGHRGLPSARLFTDIDKLTEGDYFILNVLNRTLTYEVDQILTVLPEEMNALQLDPNMDYCTLVTCTPYGVNTHRLLVRGHRIPNIDLYDLEGDANKKNPLIVGGILSVIFVVILLLGYFVKTTPMKRRRRK